MISISNSLNNIKEPFIIPSTHLFFIGWNESLAVTLMSLAEERMAL